MRRLFTDRDKEENVMRSQLRIRGIGKLFFIVITAHFLLSMYGCGGGGGDGGEPAISPSRSKA